MPAVTERSAGVVCYRDDPGGVAGESAGRAFLLLDHGTHRDFPKGHLERGEDDRAAALRELEEETGLAAGDVQLHEGFAEEIGYFYRDRHGRLVRKTVVFLLARTAATEVRLSGEHVGFAFLPLADAARALTHAGPRAVLRAAAAFLDASTSAK